MKRKKQTIHDRLDRIEAALVDARLPRPPTYANLSVDFDKREIHWKGRTIAAQDGFPNIVLPVLEAEYPGTVFWPPFEDEA